MKVAVRLLGVSVLGLAVAAVWYPLLHEAGHAAAAVLVGAKVMQADVFPLAYVTCDIRGVSLLGTAWIGLSGVLFPALVASVPLRRFWPWCAQLFLKVASFIALAIEMTVCITKSTASGYDAVWVYRCHPKGVWWAVAVMSVAAIGLLVGLVREKPVSRCIRFFEL